MSEKWLDHVKLLETRIVLTDKQLAELLPTLPLEERIATVIGKYVGGAVSMHMNGENTCQQADARIAKYLLGKVKPWLSLSAPSTPASGPPECEFTVKCSDRYPDNRWAWCNRCVQKLVDAHLGLLASSPQEKP